jgi:hypothetical protein
MRRTTLKRRTFLRGVGGAMLALPVLEAMLDRHGTALAQGRALPKRFGVFFWGNGVRLDRWNPSSTGPNYALSPALAPLSPVRDYVNVISNFKVRAAGPRGHHDGVSGMLSGREFIELPHPNSNYSSKFGGPSIDQILHGDLNVGASKPVLNLQVAPEIVTGEGPTLQFISHKGPDEPQTPTQSPAAVYQQLFGSFEQPGSTDPKNALRASILDLVKDDIDALKPRLSTTDRQRLDAHLTGISELRARIAALPPELVGACAIPEPITVSTGDLRTICDLHADLMAMAFACDIRQIATVLRRLHRLPRRRRRPPRPHPRRQPRGPEQGPRVHGLHDGVLLVAAAEAAGDARGRRQRARQLAVAGDVGHRRGPHPLGRRLPDPAGWPRRWRDALPGRPRAWALAHPQEHRRRARHHPAGDGQQPHKHRHRDDGVVLGGGRRARLRAARRLFRGRVRHCRTRSLSGA